MKTSESSQDHSNPVSQTALQPKKPRWVVFAGWFNLILSLLFYGIVAPVLYISFIASSAYSDNSNAFYWEIINGLTSIFTIVSASTVYASLSKKHSVNLERISKYAAPFPIILFALILYFWLFKL